MQTNELHPNFNVVGTQTGRTNCSMTPEQWEELKASIIPSQPRVKTDPIEYAKQRAKLVAIHGEAKVKEMLCEPSYGRHNV